jgi:FG-GAP-like repeat
MEGKARTMKTNLFTAGMMFAALTPTLSYSQTAQNFIIDPQPPGQSLEKTVNFFTSATMPSVVNGTNNGIYLYTSSSGTLAGPWVMTTIDPDGYFYERSKPISFAGDSFPNIVASRSGQLVVYFNPMNGGGDPTRLWPAYIINPDAGCNDLRVADLDQDGRLDVVCSAASADGTKSFIAFQNNFDDWQIVNDPFKIPGSSDGIGDAVAVVSVNGSPRIHVVGANRSGTYWFENPKLTGGDPRRQPWQGYFVGDGNGGATLGTGVFNASGESIAVASYEMPWAPGLVWYEPHPNAQQPWIAHTIDSTYRDVHQINTGSFYGIPYVIVGEIEQACGTPDIVGEHPGIPCRVTMFLFGNNSFVPFEIYDQGTHNQSVIPYNGGLLVVGANHGVYGTLYPALQAWTITK